MDNERLTWEQIKQKYPHQCVGLVDVESGINSISVKSAIVKYTEKDTPYEKLLELAMAGEIHLLYTTLDEDEIID
ncbi:MAG: hypothetical protein U0L79_07750 [Lachnospiraceae bacterium]|nr:hypothetical protein [Lachnospiraceae bacterium]